MTPQTRAGAASLAAYVTSIVAANALTARYGMVPVGFGLAATAGTFAAGGALLLRDLVHDTLGRAWVAGGILLGALLTYATSAALAFASAAAFLLAEYADMSVYTPLRERGWATAVLASNAVGAVADTVVFLWLAGVPVTAAGVGGQLVGKLVWAAILPVTLVVLVRAGRDALPRHSLGA